MAVTYDCYKFVTVSTSKRLCNGGFRIQIATWIQKWFKIPAGNSRKLYIYIIVFPGGDDGRGYRNMYKIPQGPNLNECHWHYALPLPLLYQLYKPRRPLPLHLFPCTFTVRRKPAFLFLQLVVLISPFALQPAAFCCLYCYGRSIRISTFFHGWLPGAPLWLLRGPSP
jgi:hypothetical protein